MNRVTDFKIEATVVLTELPVNVELSVDKVYWLTISEKDQAHYIWDALRDKYPLAMDIAMANGRNMQEVSYIDAKSIKVS